MLWVAGGNCAAKMCNRIRGNRSRGGRLVTLPYLTVPYLTLPYLTLPYLTLPYLTLPYLTLSRLTLSYLIAPSRFAVCFALLLRVAHLRWTSNRYPLPRKSQTNYGNFYFPLFCLNECWVQTHSTTSGQPVRSF